MEKFYYNKYYKCNLLRYFMIHNCEKCSVEIPEKVYDYSKKNYGKVLCRDCQKGFNLISKKKKKDSKKKEEPNGLTKRENFYKEGMIKGRIAETLIEELFLTLKYNVFRYGMENTVPVVMKLLRDVKTEVANDIRRMPDFVIQSNEGKNKGEVYFIEVKFRKSEEFDKNDPSIKDYPYRNTYFIIVSKKYIKCITYGELQEGKVVSPKSKNYLGNRKEFELDKEVIKDFCDFAIKFFKEV